MKKFLAILVLGIGIVLLIPDKTFAACNLTLDEADTDRYQCNDGDTMTITSNGSIERIWTNIDAGHVSSGGTATTGVTINNAGTIYARDSGANGTGISAVFFDESTNAIDKFTENKMFNNINKNYSDKILIVISHKDMKFNFFNKRFILKNKKLARLI